jgi:type I restriction enzyme S subunit
VETYRNRIEEDKYSKKANLQLIADNDYNLNIPRYVDTFEAEGIIDIDETCDLLKKINDLSIRNDEKIFSICNELKIPQPTGNNIFLLKQYKKGIMQKIFSQELRFKDDNGNDYPDWEETKVKDIFVVTRGNVLSMNLVTKEQDENNLFPVYSSQTKNNGLSGYYDKFLFEDCITWTTDGAGAGDVNFRKGKFYCTNVCGVLKSDKGYANTFVAEILNSVSRKYVSYVGNPKLMNNVMSEIQISIPTSIEEQTKIATFLSAIDDKISHCGVQIEKMEVWKKGLLQQMFC